MGTTWRRRLLRSPLGAWAVLPHRLREVGRHDVAVAHESARWLLHSREFTNYTYEIGQVNREHLAWFVAGVGGVEVDEARTYIDELDRDEALREHVATVTAQEPSRRRLADREVRWGRRLGWYALARALRPDHIVETGSDKGLGTVAFAAAVLRNGRGRVTAIDQHADAGYLAFGRYGEVVTRLVGSSLEVLPTVGPMDLFLHDSLRSREYETAEVEVVAPQLMAGGVVLSNTGDISAGLPAWAETTGRRFAFWHERPVGHWYPGAGIAAAFPRR